MEEGGASGTAAETRERNNGRHNEYFKLKVKNKLSYWDKIKGSYVNTWA